MRSKVRGAVRIVRADGVRTIVQHGDIVSGTTDAPERVMDRERLPFHGGDCYACDQRATGFRDLRPEGGSLEPACKRHADPSIRTFDACMYCDGAVRRGSLVVDGDFAHRACHQEALQ